MELFVKAFLPLLLVAFIPVLLKVYTCFRRLAEHPLNHDCIDFSCKSNDYVKLKDILKIRIESTASLLLMAKFFKLAGYIHYFQGEYSALLEVDRKIDAVQKWKNSAFCTVILDYDITEETAKRSVEIAWEQNLRNFGGDIWKAIEVKMGFSIFPPIKC